MNLYGLFTPNERDFWLKLSLKLFLNLFAFAWSERVLKRFLSALATIVAQLVLISKDFSCIKRVSFAKYTYGTGEIWTSKIKRSLSCCDAVVTTSKLGFQTSTARDGVFCGTLQVIWTFCRCDTVWTAAEFCTLASSHK